MSEDPLDFEFDLFDDRPTKLNVVGQHVEVCHATYLAAEYPGVTTFTISPAPSFFTSSKILLRMIFRVFKRTATNEVEVLDGDKIAPINNFISSAFSTLQCTINGVSYFFFLFDINYFFCVMF